MGEDQARSYSFAGKSQRTRNAARIASQVDQRPVGISIARRE